MKYGKILPVMTALAACLLIGIAYGQDYLEGGNVKSSSGSGSVMGSSGDYLSPNMGQGSSRANPDEGVSDMVQWLDQPVTKDATKSTTSATRTTPSPDAAKSTATRTSAAPGHDDEKSTTTTTSSTPATEPTSTTKSTTSTSTTPGFEATFDVAGLLVLTFLALRRRR